MTDWHEGQKIVCVNSYLPPEMDNGRWTGSTFIKQLKEGQIYTIDKIAMVHYESLNGGGVNGIDVGFLLQGLETNYTKNSMPQVDKYGEKFYHFWHGRFRPLEEEEKNEKISLSVFQGLLNDVNDGKVKFDEEPKHMKPKRQVEFT